MIAILNQLVQGILLGGFYALLGAGLSLSVGVLKFVNIAHGDLIVLFSFILLAVATAFGLPPFVALVLVLPFAFVFGYGLQRLLLQRVLGRANILAVLLVTFGISVVVQNGLLEIFGPNTRKLAEGSLEIQTITLVRGINVGVFPLMALIAAVATVAVLDPLLHRTTLGAQIRAVSDDIDAALLVGMRPRHIYAVAMGLVGVTLAISAYFLAVRTNFDPSSGPRQLLLAFEAVVIGGLGSLWGTLLGGILLGLAQAVGGQIDATWEVVAGHLLFLLVMLFKPNGLLPR
jgi:branched-chain amino acid transport system permease protein